MLPIFGTPNIFCIIFVYYPAILQVVPADSHCPFCSSPITGALLAHVATCDAPVLSRVGLDQPVVSGGIQVTPLDELLAACGDSRSTSRNIPPHTVPVKCEPSAPSVPPSTGANYTMPGEPADTSTPAHTASELIPPPKRCTSRRISKQDRIYLRSPSDLENDEANSNQDSRPKRTCRSRASGVHRHAEVLIARRTRNARSNLSAPVAAMNNTEPATSRAVRTR